MNDTLKMCRSIGLEIMNRYFVVAMCFKRQINTIRQHFPLKNLYIRTVLIETFIVKRSTFYCCKQLYNIIFQNTYSAFVQPLRKSPSVNTTVTLYNCSATQLLQYTPGEDWIYGTFQQ